MAKSGESLQAFKIGEINVSQTLNGKTVRCVIKNVLYVPHLRKNLLSSGKIEQNGLSIVLNNEIHNKNGHVAEGIRKGTLYEVVFNVIKSNAYSSEKENNYDL